MMNLVVGPVQKLFLAFNMVARILLLLVLKLLRCKKNLFIYQQKLFIKMILLMRKIALL